MAAHLKQVVLGGEQSWNQLKNNLQEQYKKEKLIT